MVFNTLFDYLSPILRRSARRTSRWRPVRLSLERLEDRLTPAILTEFGAMLTVTLDSSNESLGIVSAGSSYALTSTNPFVDGGITAGRVTVIGMSAPFVEAQGQLASTAQKQPLRVSSSEVSLRMD